MSKRKILISAVILTTISLVYFFVHGPTLDFGLTFGDDAVMFRETKTIAERGKIDMSQTFGVIYDVTTKIDGRAYPNKPIGTSLAAVPFYYAGKLVGDSFIPSNNKTLDASLNGGQPISFDANIKTVSFPFSVNDSELSEIQLDLDCLQVPDYHLDVWIATDDGDSPSSSEIIGSVQSITCEQIKGQTGIYVKIPYSASLDVGEKYWLVIDAAWDNVNDKHGYVLTAGKENPADFGLTKKTSESAWKKIERGAFFVLKSSEVVKPTAGAMEFEEMFWTVAAIKIFTVLVSVASVFLIFLILHQIFLLSFSASYLTALIAALGTLIWRYSTLLFVHSLSLFLALLGLYFLLRITVSGKRNWHYYLGLGLAAGYSVFTDYTNALIALGLFIFLFWFHFRRKIFKQYLIRLSVFILGISLPILALAYYQAKAFGSPLATSYKFYTGYPSFIEASGFFTLLHWKNVVMMLFGQRLAYESMDGIFVAIPIITLSLIGYIYFFRNHRAVAVLMASLVATIFVFVSFFYIVFGGGTRDYRYLLTAVIFLILPLGFFMDRFICRRLARGWSLLWHVAFWFMTFFTIWINFTYTTHTDIISYFLRR